MSKRPKTVQASCNIVAVGKRRDGGTRYWCLFHGADATAKYGRRAPTCRYAHIPTVAPTETAAIDIDDYAGGIGVWGAVPPVFDTTSLPIDRGIHVHARRTAESEKAIDETYRRVCLKQGATVIELNELDAIYFMVSMVFGKRPEEVICSHCHASHLDKDWFSVHPHRRHLCAGCGKHFRDDKIAIGNPAARAAALVGGPVAVKAAMKSLRLRQADFPGGIRIWGSNPAILWTRRAPERSGIHVHAYAAPRDAPAIDDTFARVIVDGVPLDPEPVRTYMAQMALPHLSARVVAASCRDCGSSAFDRGDDAFAPRVGRVCEKCGGTLDVPGRYRRIVANPLVGALGSVEKYAVRAAQRHDLGLLPETI